MSPGFAVYCNCRCSRDPRQPLPDKPGCVPRHGTHGRREVKEHSQHALHRWILVKVAVHGIGAKAHYDAAHVGGAYKTDIHLQSALVNPRSAGGDGVATVTAAKLSGTESSVGIKWDAMLGALLRPAHDRLLLSEFQPEGGKPEGSGTVQISHGNGQKTVPVHGE